MLKRTTMRVFLCVVSMATMAAAEVGTPTMSNFRTLSSSLAQADAAAVAPSSQQASAAANFFKSLSIPGSVVGNASNVVIVPFPVPSHDQQHLSTRGGDKNNYGEDDYEDNDEYGKRNKKRKNKNKGKFDQFDVDELFADFDKDNKKKGQNLAGVVGGSQADQLSSVVSGAFQTLGLPQSSADSLLSSGSPLLQSLLTSTSLPAGASGQLGNLLGSPLTPGLLASLAPLLPALGGADLSGLAGPLASLLPGLGGADGLSSLASALPGLGQLGGGDLGSLAGLASAAVPLLGAGGDLGSLAGLASAAAPLLGAGGDLGSLAGLASAAAPFLGAGGDLGSLAGLASAAAPLLGSLGGVHPGLIGSLAPLLGSLVGRDASDAEKAMAVAKLDQLARQGVIDLNSIFGNIAVNGLDGAISSSSSDADDDNSNDLKTLLTLLQAANRPQGALVTTAASTGVADSVNKPVQGDQQALLAHLLLQLQQQQQNNKPAAAASSSNNVGGGGDASVVQLAQVFSAQLAQLLDARRRSSLATKMGALTEDAKLLRTIADALYPKNV